MGWQSTKYVTRAEALAVLHENISSLGDDTLAKLINQITTECDGLSQFDYYQVRG